GSGPFTLFPPTDAAFNLLPAGTVTALLNDIPALTDILKHHVVADSVMSSMLANNQSVTTLLGTDVTVTISGGNVYIDNAMVTLADLVADNGVVHVIDAVLLPPTNTIYDIVSNSPDHTTLKAAIDACSLDGVLSGPGPFTLFAPTDAAFNLLPAGTVTALLNDIPQLTDILKHHVVGSSVMSTMLTNNQVVTTLNGTDITVTINSMGDVFIDNAQVVVADIVADNGVVHVIDAVLLPSTTSINEGVYSIKQEFLYTLNLLGEKVINSTKNQIVFDIYSDGSVVKRFVK
ncbi:MAG: beta-Ig-H3/fasciclin, partial [Chloroflexi bacterium]|nr:beta-Ig-H3/fasciclin [Chloroflexota bacterium]